MDSAFIYGHYVSGKNFIGRHKDVDALVNLISSRENIALVSTPKGGKTSLLQQAFFKIKTTAPNFAVCEIDLRSIRDLKAFLRIFGDAVIRQFAGTQPEYREIVGKYLQGTHFVFDSRSFAEDSLIISLNWEPDEKDIRTLMNLPYLLSASAEKQTVMVLRQFQDIRFIEKWEELCHILEDIIKEQDSMLGRPYFSIVATGSMPNAMDEIFRHRRFFYRQFEQFTPSSIDEKDICESIVKGFLSSGKVIDRGLLQGVVLRLQGDMHHINHFFAICDQISKGYINENVLIDALENLIAIHESSFNSIMEDLTNYQVNLLRAICDGHTKFSSAEVIRSYNLSSSANVKRLKDALAKKEIIIFSENDDARFEDPLFEYWVKKYFFRTKGDF